VFAKGFICNEWLRQSNVKINEIQDSDYEDAKITYVGFVDPYGVEGILDSKVR